MDLPSMAIRYRLDQSQSLESTSIKQITRSMYSIQIRVAKSKWKRNRKNQTKSSPSSPNQLDHLSNLKGKILSLSQSSKRKIYLAVILTTTTIRLNTTNLILIHKKHLRLPAVSTRPSRKLSIPISPALNMPKPIDGYLREANPRQLSSSLRLRNWPPLGSKIWCSEPPLR